MSSVLARLLLVAAWIGAVWGSLQIHRFDLNLQHGVCGPWGCGPPVEALIGYHGFWFLLFLPVAAGVGLYLPSTVNRKVGLSLLTFGLLTICLRVGLDVGSYVSHSGTSHAVQRGFFTLVTTVDLPMIPTVLAGVLLAFFFGRDSKETSQEQTESADEASGVSSSPFAPDV